MTDEELDVKVERALDAKIDAFVVAVADAAKERFAREQDVVVARERENSNATLAAARIANKAERRVWRWAIGSLMTLVMGGGAAGVYQSSRTPEIVGERVDRLETEIAGCTRGGCTVEQKAASVKGRLEKAEKKIDRLGELHFQQLEISLDQGDELRRKLNAISDDAKTVPVPPSVDDARDAMNAYEQLKRKEAEKVQAEEENQKGDPFAGIE